MKSFVCLLAVWLSVVAKCGDASRYEPGRFVNVREAINTKIVTETVRKTVAGPVTYCARLLDNQAVCNKRRHARDDVAASAAVAAAIVNLQEQIYPSAPVL